MQFKEMLAAGKDDQHQLGIGTRAEEFSERKYLQDKDNSVLTRQRNAKPPSAIQFAPETFSQIVPGEVHLNFGKNKNEKRNLVHEMVQISAGQQHSMILEKDGSVYSWGLGMSGQLGLTYDQIQENDLIVAQ